MIDKDTMNTLQKGREIKEMLESPGWGHVRELIHTKILDLQSIMNIDGNADTVITEMLARKTSVTTLMDLLRVIEGAKEQYETNSKIEEEDFIKRT